MPAKESSPKAYCNKPWENCLPKSTVNYALTKNQINTC